MRQRRSASRSSGLRRAGHGLGSVRWFLALIVLGAVLTPVASLGVAAAPLCVMEIWTDKTEYKPGEPVTLHMWLSVGTNPRQPQIRNAKLQVEVKQPAGSYVTLATRSDITLRQGAEWDEPLVTLPTAAEPFRDLGLYQVRAVLLTEGGNVLCEAFASFTIRSGFGRTPTTHTLIVTSRRTALTDPFVSTLAVWLEAAYQTRVLVIYQEGLFQTYTQGLYEDFDVIIYYGLDYVQGPPSELIADIFEGTGPTKKKVVWIGYHLDKVQAYLSRYGLRYDELTTSGRPAQLKYVDAGVSYDLFAPDRAFVRVVNPELARVRATVGGRPILVSAKQEYHLEDGECFYFVGFHPTAYLAPFGAHLVFLDVLNEVYGIEREKVALLRLEDVSARTDPDNLLAITRFLKQEGIPFSLALIPIYADGTGLQIRLTESRAFRTTIKRALLDGGELILHGATHQYDGVSATDYEFWDEVRGVPIGGREFAEQRVKLAMAEVRGAGLAPHLIGWATPKYAAGEEAYAVFEEQFKLIYENPRGYGLTSLPYPVVTENTIYVPTNVGYVRDGNRVADVELILRQASLLAGLQHGALASFFYHPFLGVEYLERIISGLREQGWTFRPVSLFLGGQ